MSKVVSKIEDKYCDRDLKNRLRTIRGHIAGIEGMIDDNKGCLDVLHQVLAVKAALGKVERSILESYARECFREVTEQSTESDKTLDEVLNVILKFID